MNRAQIIRIVPISNQILLLVFKDTQTEKHDVKFILHHIPDVKPRSDLEGFKAFLYENEHLISEWERDIKCDAYSSEKETAEVTLSASEEDWSEMEAACAAMEVTVEQFARALAYFCVEPGTKEALEQWYIGLEPSSANCAVYRTVEHRRYYS